MAWSLPRSSITPQQEKLIGEYLWLQPKAAYGNEVPAKVKAYTADTTNVALPFYFGRLLSPNTRVPQLLRQGVRPWSFKAQLRPHQIEMVAEVCKFLYYHGTANLNAYCSAGKTVMGAYAAAWVNAVTTTRGVQAPIIITYTLTVLEKQWLETIQNFTDATIEIVATSQDALALEGRPVADIYLCMMESLPQLPEDIRKRCQMLMVDEAHLFCTGHRLERLLTVEPASILLLTASRVKVNGMEVIMSLLAGPHATVRIATMPFTVWDYRTGLKPPIVKNAQGKVDWGKIVDWLVVHPERNRKILEIVKANPTYTIAIMTTRVPHAEQLYEMLKATGESVGIMCGSRRTYTNCRVLIGTISKVGVGFDQKAACADFDGKRINLLIVAVSTKQIEQIAGRAFRADNPHIVHIVDDGKIFDNHLRECMIWYLQGERKDKVEVRRTDQVIELPAVEE